VSKWRRTSWQEVIIAQASFLEYERKRLCGDDHQSGIAGQQPGTSPSAFHTSDAAKKHLDEARQAAGAPAGQRLANLWSGALVHCAFINLHHAKVVLVDLYAEADIQAAAPAVLARLQTCLPAHDQRRQRAEALFGSQISEVPASARSRGRLNGEGRIQPGRRGRWPLVLPRAARPASSPRGGPRCATPCRFRMTRRMSSTPVSAASGTS
jgi:hypothetical protein